MVNETERLQREALNLTFTSIAEFACPGGSRAIMRNPRTLELCTIGGMMGGAQGDTMSRYAHTHAVGSMIIFNQCTWSIPKRKQ